MLITVTLVNEVTKLELAFERPKRHPSELAES